MSKAWIVMIVDVSTSPPTVRGAGVFSEPNPTMRTDMRTVALGAFEGDNYAAAAAEALFVLSDNHYSWLGEFYPTRRTRIHGEAPR